MADIVYGITITSRLFEGIEIYNESNFLKTVKTNKDTVTMPCGHNLYKTAAERNVALFKNKKNHLSIDKVAIKYNISEKEALDAYNRAMEEFPEKFI